ncbi:alpha/beta hydrolase [Streptomyces sp. ISL-98]|uniref:alpha/beta fold hydrolase n=1 Tax=Streptomyces sp. ISL-98 TaxID=2819192 RepID=UPI001BE4FE4E|nr:alpha/beta hydrolase [Streptomyces sp. ISL-98]MBT2508275.1 alpha/beta hydrolase [Streptomyces sp. ISL-98]
MRTVDGRHLAVDRLGDPCGTPVFLLHGTPGSRLGAAPRSMVECRPGMQVIVYDRPGYGGSDRRPGRSIADAAEDVRSIADALGLERFAVAGRSGGAPHALACAALLPGRVTRTAALVSLAPRDSVGLDWFDGMTASNVRDYTTASSHPEEIAERLAVRSATIRKDPARLLDELERELTDTDRRIVSDAEVRSMLITNYVETLRSSAYGWIDDVLATCRPWGFDPADIPGPVLLWHGEKDGFSPVGHARWLAERIPGATAVLDPAASHFDAINALPGVFGWLLGERWT